MAAQGTNQTTNLPLTPPHSDEEGEEAPQEVPAVYDPMHNIGQLQQIQEVPRLWAPHMDGPYFTIDPSMVSEWHPRVYLWDIPTMGPWPPYLMWLSDKEGNQPSKILRQHLEWEGMDQQFPPVEKCPICNPN